MKKKLQVRMILAVVLAILAGMATYQYLGGLRTEVDVVVAAVDIPAYEMLSTRNLKVIQVDAETKNRMFPHTATMISEVAGSIARKPFAAMEPIERDPENLLFGEERTIALNYDGKVDKAYFVPYDKRVITVETDKTGAYEGLKAGDYVDIIYTSQDDTGYGSFSNMLLQHVRIFNIERVTQADVGPNAGSRTVVQLLASPEECVALAIAKRTGTLDLILNPLNGETVAYEGMHAASLMIDPPLTNAEAVTVLSRQIANESALSPMTKQTLLMALEKETDIETLRLMIQSTDIPEPQKAGLLQTLGVLPSAPPQDSFNQLRAIEETIENTVLEEVEKDALMEAIEAQSEAILTQQKQADIARLKSLVEDAAISDEVKEALLKALDEQEAEE